MDWVAKTARTVQQFARAFGNAARDGKVIELPGVVASVSPAIPVRSLFNAAAYTDADQLAVALPALGEEFKLASVTAWGVWAHDSDEPAGEVLAGHGLRVDSRPMAMAARIEEILPSSETRDGERTRDLEAVDQVLAAAYGFPPGVMTYCFPHLLREFHGYLVREPGGEPACVLATVERERDCGITLVGTDPRARGRGLASELVCHALIDAASRGCTTATLQATAMGLSLYRRLGFRELGAMNLWEWRGGGDAVDARGSRTPSVQTGSKR